jgi:glutamate synthase domain-containing protein 2
MYRRHFYLILGISFVLLSFIAWVSPGWRWLLGLWLLVAVTGLFDLRSRHNVLNNYPVIGHLRYLLEFIRPELRQYFFESESSGRPFNREQRELINHRADGSGDAMPFGTVRDIELAGYDLAYHSLSPKTVDDNCARVQVGGADCTQPYLASCFNISGMSFGALSGRAIEAMNLGAKLGGFAQVTGEGGISPYHQKHGGDLIWQIGTGYFGCRDDQGEFDPDEFATKAQRPQVKMIELKLSQGAKPAHGGLLPAAKVNDEIASAREVTAGEDCQSPAAHSSFSSPSGLLDFIERLRQLSGGKPVGFKLCVGSRKEFLGICKAMLDSGIRPDFITIDGAEGGTGAAPAEFSDRLGLFINEALFFVHNALTGCGLRNEIKLIASGKVALGFDMVVKHALGADLCHAARPYMFAVGCIQSRRCHTNTCPTGVATQDSRRAQAIDVQDKAQRVRRYHQASIRAFFDLTGAMGFSRSQQLTADCIMHRVEDGPAISYADLLGPMLEANALIEDKPLPAAWQRDWQQASASAF